MSGSDLSRSLVDAAAEAARQERVRSLRDTGKSASDDAQAAQVVAAVLETLARSGQVAWAESLQALANEIKEASGE